MTESLRILHITRIGVEEWVQHNSSEMDKATFAGMFEFLFDLPSLISSLASGDTTYAITTSFKQKWSTLTWLFIEVEVWHWTSSYGKIHLGLEKVLIPYLYQFWDLKASLDMDYAKSFICLGYLIQNQ